MKLTKEALIPFLASLITDAKNDAQFSIAWFNPTKDLPFSIVGGWQGGFDPEDTDCLLPSKSSPTYAMCVKIVVNEGPYAYTDFEIMNMPYDEEGNVDDTEVALEWDDNPEEAARWLLCEWERIMEEHGEEI
jgi:hypothetical protein